ncbi:carboxypeptidase regulatory-like domain-containing protein [uncultured Aminobacterium sp.]|mgnify:CR=1 FL=1|jgi:hypothetical protein|uniref:carboxypeptidase regulatory-like domain-containing protein n=1 Tax=uncultured Aminobacterium sp. TaxID=548265 RepID=UPI0025959F9D|nr:carboxypeptidase regulatory-like domain-containing protein [uncultured Aminobacterium sp.]
MRKVIIISIFLFLILFSSNASGFEDTVERYPTGAYTDYWTYSTSADMLYGVYTLTKGVTSHPFVSNNNVLYMQSTVDWDHYHKYPRCFTYQSLTSKYDISDSYFSFIVVDNSSIPNRSPYNLTYHNDLVVTYLRPTDNYVLCNVHIIMSPGHKYEIIKSGDNKVSLYDNGVKKSDINYNTAYTDGVVKPRITYEWGSDKVDATTTGHVYIDDISTSSCIGIPTLTNEGVDNFSFTWSSQLMRSYSDQQKISLYSLSNPNNAGLIKTWDLENSPEFGEISDDRGDVLGSNFGLYMLEMSRGSDILTDQYFYYDQLSNPNGFPELLFLGESSVKTEIRDDNYNGGEIAGGGSVYLYPKIKEDAAYNFTYNILEAPYKIKTELTTVYNNTPINSTTIYYTRLSNQNYRISVDGADAGSTNGADTFSHTFTDWGTEKNHIISFAPDYSIAGVWGEVKNSETQQGIKSATVSISGANFSKTIYTDDNGLFYLTKGMEPGKTYTISVSKTGYSTPPSQTAITTDGSTTRQDFYMDKLSTSGSGMYYAPHDVSFKVLEHWYSGAGLTGVSYTIYNGTEQIKTGTTDSKGMFTGSDMTGGTNYTIVLTHNGKTYTEYIEPSLSEYTFVLNKEGILHQYANPWLTLSYTENSQNVTITYESNKTIAGASLTAIAGNGTIVYTQTLNTNTGSFIFETGGKGDYTLNFHVQATDGSTASQSWGLSYPDKIPLFPDSYPAWLKNILFSGIVMVFLMSFGKSKNDVACGSVAILTSMGYLFGWFTGSFYFVVLVWIIALGSIFLHYKRTGGIG